MCDESNGTKIFVLDTNILLLDYACLLNFEEHDISLPLVVTEELDGKKEGTSEVARNARTVSRHLAQLIGSKRGRELEEGVQIVPLEENGIVYSLSKERGPLGKLMFVVSMGDTTLPVELAGSAHDNMILRATLALMSKHPLRKVILVTRDINLRIKAAVLDIEAQDYRSDQIVEDDGQIHPGIIALPDNFWDTHGRNLESWPKGSDIYYKIEGELVRDWHLNMGVYDEAENGMEALVVEKPEPHIAVLRLAKDYRTVKHAVWGIMALNREQNIALNLLLDPDIDFVTLLGTAGTGKTLLTLASALTQTLDLKLYKEIVMSRDTIPLGEDIGFLPGSEEEKMTPWMGALLDNLELLGSREAGGAWERGATNQLLLNRVKVRSLNFMRGRTFLKRYLILDEAQNLTAKQMKALVTRAGPGTKIVCLGNNSQIDARFLTSNSNGLTYAIEKFRGWPYSAHVTLRRGERSRLADHATAVL
jgi:PhoH-like ATPase